MEGHQDVVHQKHLLTACNSFRLKKNEVITDKKETSFKREERKSLSDRKDVLYKRDSINKRETKLSPVRTSRRCLPGKHMHSFYTSHLSTLLLSFLSYLLFSSLLLSSHSAFSSLLLFSFLFFFFLLLSSSLLSSQPTYPIRVLHFIRHLPLALLTPPHIVLSFTVEITVETIRKKAEGKNSPQSPQRSPLRNSQAAQTMV